MRHTRSFRGRPNLSIAGSSSIAWSVSKNPDGSGWTGKIDLPIGSAILSHGDHPTQALHGAAELAKQVLSNPTLQTLMPPGVSTALAALHSKLASNIASGAWRGLRHLF